MKSLLAILFVCSAALSSCAVTQPKVEAWLQKHPGAAAGYCAKNYPCKPEDSTSSEQTDSMDYRSALEDLNGFVADLNRVNDSLYQELEHRDTNCRKYAPVIASLQRRLMALRDSIVSLPPKVVTKTNTVRWVDHAAVKAAEAIADQLRLELEVYQERLRKKGESLSTWKKIALGSIGLNALLVVILIKRRK